MVYIKVSTVFFKSDPSLNYNKSINLFGFIIIHSSSWPITVGPVSNVSFFFLSKIAFIFTEPSLYSTLTTHPLWMFVILSLSPKRNSITSVFYVCPEELFERGQMIMGRKEKCNKMTTLFKTLLVHEICKWWLLAVKALS